MTDTLTYNLEILSEETNSLAGFVIKISKSDFEILAAFNEQTVDIIPFVNDLRRLLINNNLSNAVISELDSYLYFSVEKNIKSYVFEKISEDKNDYSVFLLLLSNIKENYNKENSALIRKYIMNFNKQINESFSKEFNQAEHVETFKGEWFTRNRELIFSALLESFKDLFFILDENGYIIALNKNGARSLDYSELDMRGRYLLDFVKSDEKQKILELFKIMLSDKGMFEQDVTLIGKYENEIPFHITCTLIEENGKIIGVLGTGNDRSEGNALRNKITELQHRLIENIRLIDIEKSRSDLYKDVLSDLNRLRNDFVSNLSHEFRTPLASIIGFAETLISDKDMPDEMRNEFDEIILHEGKRLAKLINDILELSRYEQGKIELTRTEFNIAALLKSVIDDLTPTIENKGLILSCNFPSSPVKIIADLEKIKMVFNGILNNSIKYTPKGGRITWMIKSFREEIEVICTDTGLGISENEFPYIFHKFYHSSKGSKEYIQNDIDLVFIKQIIDLHKGIIKIQSETNKGTSVLIKLPNKFNY
ncbi:MAG TPA: PAS domain-containing sensor histidine kinase [Ignavibacteriaceae bacterium]|nr:PAS domain-containing sensor histidine kinase [Ignavibacteriaceae bacterium]